MDRKQINQKPIALVCNPEAGKGKAAAVEKIIRKQLDEQIIPYQRFIIPWPPDLEGFGAVWLVGGDGTLHYFINKYPDLSIPLALFKGGSGNDFAWALYGNRSVADCIQAALSAHPRSVDAGTCNGKYFINGVGIGFDGEVVSAMGKRRILPGHLAYLATVLRQIFMYREKEMLIQEGSRAFREKVFMIAIANGSRYGGGFRIAPQAKVDDGLFDVVLIRSIARLKRLFHLPKVEKGRHLKLSFVDSFPAKKLTISAEEPLKAHLDGEYIQANQFTIELLPGRFLFLY